MVLAPDPFWRMEPGIELGYTEADFGKAMGYYQRLGYYQRFDATSRSKMRLTR